MLGSSQDVRIRLAHALGYHEYPANATVEPYLAYICKRHIGKGALEDWLELFIEVIEHFAVGTIGPGDGDSIQALMDRFAASGFRGLFTDTSAGQTVRLQHVEDTVMYILGTWTTMLSSFVQQRNQSRKVLAAYKLCSIGALSAANPYESDLAGLVAGCELMPGGRWDRRHEFGQDITTKLMMMLASSPNTPASPMHMSFQSLRPQVCGNGSSIPSQLYEDIDAYESLSIRATRLNAFTLNVLSAVQITWTQNVSRHMSLSKTGGRYEMELFSLPCTFDATTSKRVGIPTELAQEIQESYAMLFNAWDEITLHMKLGGMFGIRKVCWCWSCSAYRYRRKCIMDCKRDAGNIMCKEAASTEFDPLLIQLCERPSEFAWTPDDFPHLWSRITRLERHLQTSRPWSLWILFRDRRDTMQFWTFLFATIVVMLTVVQVILGVAQVVGTFK